jgi:hypothetical protein
MIELDMLTLLYCEIKFKLTNFKSK